MIRPAAYGRLAKKSSRTFFRKKALMSPRKLLPSLRKAVVKNSSLYRPVFARLVQRRKRFCVWAGSWPTRLFLNIAQQVMQSTVALFCIFLLAISCRKARKVSLREPGSFLRKRRWQTLWPLDVWESEIDKRDNMILRSKAKPGLHQGIKRATSCPPGGCQSHFLSGQ